jgi:hypothetical protein
MRRRGGRILKNRLPCLPNATALLDRSMRRPCHRCNRLPSVFDCRRAVLLCGVAQRRSNDCMYSARAPKSSSSRCEWEDLHRTEGDVAEFSNLAFLLTWSLLAPSSLHPSVFASCHHDHLGNEHRVLLKDRSSQGIFNVRVAGI